MADDNRMRTFQPNDPSRGGAVPASERDRSNDPLAELARLIGQSDPFGEQARSNAGDAAPRQHTPPTTEAPDWRNRPPPYALMRAQPAPAAAHPDQAVRSAPARDYADGGGYASDEGGSAADNQGYATEPQFSDPSYHDYGAAGQDGHEPDGRYYDEGTAAEQNEDATCDDQPRARRRGALITALTLIGFAVLGTAGAYGYRNYYATPSSAPAPVIVADKTPTKVVPASDAQSSKVIQDRVGDPPATERVVPREEQPVVLKPPPAVAAPPVMFAPTSPASTASIGGSQAFPPAPAPVPSAAAPAASAPAAANEPKRVRTVTIRPDGSDVSGRPVTATPSGAAAPASKGARGAPLQLDPQQVPETTSAPARNAPVTPPAARVASAPSSGGTGGYVVQISSQRSENEAQASFRAMQAKYPSVLGGRSPIVKRADLGAKGVFYRALVGPFASAGEAGRLCDSLKAAGGQCIVQKN